MQYIRNVPNKESVPASDDQRRIVEDFGRYLSRWGMSPTTGRVWGYLLMCSEPASLDRISADLQVSKSSASVAARQLEQLLLARRSGERGSRRALYEATETNDHFLELVLDAYRAFLHLFEAAASVSTRPPAQKRLAEMNRFYAFWVEQLEEVVQRWRERPR